MVAVVDDGWGWDSECGGLAIQERERESGKESRARVRGGEGKCRTKFLTF